MPAIDSTNSRNGNGGSQARPSQVGKIADLASALSVVAKTFPSSDFAAFANEFDDLKVTNRSLLKTTTATIKQMEDVQQAKDEQEESLRQALDHIQDLKRQLDEKEQDLLAMAKKYDVQGKRVKLLDSYAATTHSMAQREIAALLNRIFTSAYRLVETYFGVDLVESVFSIDPWLRFKGNFRSIGLLPLPPSNSPDAKNMRMAAVLGLLGEVATRELFQPVYLGTSDDIGNVLDDASLTVQTDWLRRCLLNLNPAHTDDNIKKRVEAVTTTVAKAAADAKLPSGQLSDFKAALETWCQETAHLWSSRLQLLPSRIFPDLAGAHDDTALVHWMPLALPETETAAASPSEKNGTAKDKTNAKSKANAKDKAGDKDTASDKSKSKSTAAAAQPPTPPSSPTSPQANAPSVPAVAAVIWPVFYVCNLSNSQNQNNLFCEHIHKGYVVTSSQTLTAKSEQDYADRYPPGSRRTSRSVQRHRDSFQPATSNGDTNT